MSVLKDNNKWDIYNTIPNYIYFYGIIIKIFNMVKECIVRLILLYNNDIEWMNNFNQPYLYLFYNKHMGSTQLVQTQVQFLKSHLNTDSTKTRRAFTCIQAQKHSLKLTFNHLTNLDISFLPAASSTSLSAKFLVNKLPVCFFSIFCKLLLRLLYTEDLVLRSASICPTCLLIISAILRNDCLIGYLAMSH
ncbi:hypothetical protein AGLY_014819 [Aphis glycines]|uniref:Uncharacterized protein n=1 Tax=Aphis glycines TaxID=307491 RepID=A0A6G0T2G2_APHGL|nr:hypothetical protein AGLY_014819 [Aphis glycines]